MDREIDPGARVLATSRAIGLAAGVDWNTSIGGADFILSYQSAIRRGGLVGRGTMLRVDWIPSRNQTVGVGLTVPIAQPFAGRTRPRDMDVEAPETGRAASLPVGALPRDAEEALAAVGEAATLIRAYTNLYSDENEQALLTVIRGYGASPRYGALRYGQSYTGATRTYVEALSQAFAAAAGGASAGETASRRARRAVLDLVIIPYDSLFGRVKEKAGTIRGLTSTAHRKFGDWLRDSSSIDDGRRDAVMSVHARWLGIIETVHRDLFRQWRDSRFVWLPLQLALTPEEYDEQAEVDALLERAVGRPFTDRNALTYLRSSDLPLEIARSIFATRDYHVLWTHDFTGRREVTGTLDEIAYSMVADAYLPALTQAVARYDSTGTMPLYMILLDQYYYASRSGRIWMDILEDPLGAIVRLPGDNIAREEHIRTRQRELRTAIAASRRLTQEASTQGGERWLRSVVKVHINIAYPSDFSFRSHRILPPIPFAPDNLMRDHRKVAFYDITEADPYRGAMILTGIGIGEHYASATWEDRGYRIRGPAALEVRAGARRFFMAHGFREDQIPQPLREVASAKDAEDRMNIGDYVGRALQVQNETGFGSKTSSVARAMLYNLAPPGSVMILPDPIWVSPTWAAMVAGAAARGCRVFIIAPTLETGPNPQPPMAAMEHDVLSRLLQVRDRIGEQIRQSGGELRIGLYDAHAPVNDVAGRRREVQEGLRRAPWIRDLVPFDAKTLLVLDKATNQTEADGKDATSIARDETPRSPQLHQKTQLIARPGAIAALVRQPGWEDILASSMQAQSRQTTRFAEALGWVTTDFDSTAVRRADEMFQNFERNRTDADRRAVSFYFSLGTQNQDPRGMVLDGEATLIVSGFHAAAGLVDLYYMMARSQWIETQVALDRLLPPPTSFWARIGRLIRVAL